MYPEDDVARDLFERVGGVVVPRDEPSLEAFSAATSTFAAHLDYLATIAGWMVAHMTPGGINEQLLTGLRRDGMPEMVRQGLDAVLARLRGSAGAAGSGD